MKEEVHNCDTCAECREQILTEFADAEDIDQVLNYFCHNCSPSENNILKEKIELILHEPHAFGLTPENEEHRKEYSLLEKILDKI